MEFLKKVWPFSFGTKEVKELVIRAIIYVVADIIAGTIIGVLSNALPSFAWLWSLVGSLIGVYATAGLVFLFLSHFKVLKD